MNGVYIHIPFCKSKCPYCDFHSHRCNNQQQDDYVKTLLREIETLSGVKEFLNCGFSHADTLYLGGGTPSVLNGKQIEDIVFATKEKFNITRNAEITIECNPGSPIEELIPHFKNCGINRVSLGLQSAVDEERRLLGRTSDRKRVKEVINLLKANGINNISLDVMLGVPEQTKESLRNTLDFVKECDITHVSAYILKIEEGTFFDTHRNRFNFPTDDDACDLYEFCCDYLVNAGFNHYEISNFAKPGFESRHNTKYWILENYLGIGAAAHSFVDGKRFYFESDTEKFINGEKAIFDCYGNDAEEYIMLKLRLSTGLNLKELASIYGAGFTEKITKKAPLFKEKGLVNFDGKNLSLTRKGFLVSNTIISEFI